MGSIVDHVNDEEREYMHRCNRFCERPRFIGFGYTLDFNGHHAKFLEDLSYDIFDGTFEEWLRRQEENQRQEDELKRLEALHEALDKTCREYVWGTELCFSDIKAIDLMNWNLKRIQSFKGSLTPKTIKQ